MLWSLEALTAFPPAINMSALYKTNVNITATLIRAVGQTASLSVEEPEPLAMLRRSPFVRLDLFFKICFILWQPTNAVFQSGAFLLTAEREIHRRDSPSTHSSPPPELQSKPCPAIPACCRSDLHEGGTLIWFCSNTRNSNTVPRDSLNDNSNVSCKSLWRSRNIVLSLKLFSVNCRKAKLPWSSLFGYSTGGTSLVLPFLICF